MKRKFSLLNMLPVLQDGKLLKVCLFLLILIGVSSEVRSQEITVHGTVTDATTGNELPGVIVSVKGMSVGTSTTSDGTFKLKVPSTDTILIFSFLGYETKGVGVRGRHEINVAIKSKVFSKKEVVVTAFGQEEKKKNLVGAVSTVDASELAKVSTSNLTTALAGRVAGLIAFQRSGEPGGDNAQFFIRGVSTFGYSVSPLILIDGVESSVTQLARLQPDNIESFSILKDATATAVYGSRAANGVVLIKTKEGK